MVWWRAVAWIDVILDITSYLRNLTSRYGILLKCDITTNGTLLNPSRIDALREAGVTSYQITIDGDKTTHDAVKVMKSDSAYERTMRNISEIARTTRCCLRFNYTHENLKPDSIIADINAHINPEVRHNINFMIYKVWQERQEQIDEGEVSRLSKLSENIGIQPEMPVCGMCYADRDNFSCIFPNGMVDKCDNHSPLTAKGRLSEDTIVWSGDISSHTSAFEDPRFPCRKCRYVPICWGPCVAKRSKMLENSGKGGCQYEDKDSEMRKYILYACANLKHLQNRSQSADKE